MKRWGFDVDRQRFELLRTLAIERRSGGKGDAFAEQQALLAQLPGMRRGSEEKKALLVKLKKVGEPLHAVHPLLSCPLRS